MAGDSKKPESGAEEFQRLTRELRAYQQDIEAAANSDSASAHVAISEEGFAHLLTPRAALAELADMGRNNAIEAINERAAEGLIRVAAKTITGRRNYRPFDCERGWVDPEAWGNANAHWNHPFWSKAQIETEVRGTSSRTIRDKLHLFGVRFDPKGIEDLKLDAGLIDGPKAEAEAPTKEPRTRHGMPGLHDDLLEAWCDLFAKAYPNGTKAQAEASARGMFPGKSVDRDKVRELIAKRGIGKSHNR